MVVSKQSAYEQARQKRLEENKRRMEELNLTKLSQSLHTPKPSPMKKVRPKVPRQPVDPSSIRRSSRVADKPPVSYKDEPIEPLGRRPRIGYSRGRRDLANRVYANEEDRQYAIEKAEALKSRVDKETCTPSFVKPMLQSHVSGGYWLGLPSHFCKEHLPDCDETVTLIDEDEDASKTKYLAQKTGLSGGWRGFAIEHELVDGDALVFQLTEPTMFKVYIIRVNEPGDSES